MNNNRGIVRNCDRLGRFVIPKELRKLYDIENGDDLEVFGVSEGILIRKYQDRCVFCAAETANILMNRHVCESCAQKLKEEK